MKYANGQTEKHHIRILRSFYELVENADIKLSSCRGMDICSRFCVLCGAVVVYKLYDTPLSPPYRPSWTLHLVLYGSLFKTSSNLNRLVGPIREV